MAKPLQILLSTYNGEKYLSQLLDSLIAQDYPDFEVLVRDDGSSDSTPRILAEYASKNRKIKVVYGRNVGVIRSFFELLKNSPDDKNYYALCDQDDVWLSNKLLRGVTLLEKLAEEHKPLLYCSNLLVVDENLKIIGKAFSKPLKPSFGNALVENIATGCTIILNKRARDFILWKLPNPSLVKMHDWWFYIVISAFGQVVYDEYSSILYRQHSQNLVGTKVGFWVKWGYRLKRFLREGQTPFITLQALEFRRLFGEELDVEKRRVLDRFIEERRSFWGRLRYFLSKEVMRQSKLDDAILRILILLNRV